MHEWVLNVPLYCLTDRVMFGSMMVYFLLQAAGLLLERRFLKSCNRLKIGFVWIVVLAPAPLIMNEGLLRTLHLWPEQVCTAPALVAPQREQSINTTPRLELTP
jgi:hypothetical protein